MTDKWERRGLTIFEEGQTALAVATVTQHHKNAKAHATLIGAAPELLAALKALMPEGWADGDTMDHMPGVKAARLAIAKAEGRV